MFTIRPTTQADADAASALLAVSYGELLRDRYSDEVLRGVLPLITTAQPALLSSGTWYVAESGDGALMACGGWTKERPPHGEVEPGLGHMRHFATHPSFVRQGAARAIAQHCFDEAGEQAVSRFESFSTLTAEPFYRSLGFLSVRQALIEFDGGVVFPHVVMRRG